MINNHREKAERLIWNCGLRDLPTLVSMYILAFDLDAVDEVVVKNVYELTRDARNVEEGWVYVHAYLSTLPTNPERTKNE